MMNAQKTLKAIAAGGVLLGAAFLAAAQGNAQTAPQQGRAADSMTYQLPDMSSHPLAGSEVEMEIVVRDALGQEGRSKKIRVKLPQIDYRNPLNPKLAALRKTLALDSRKAGEVAATLGALLRNTQIANPQTRTALESVHRDLAAAKGEEALDLVVADMWRVMMQLEEDSMTAAEKNLKEAERRLQEAIEKGLSEEELKRLAEEMSKAMEEYLKERAEQEKDPEAKKTLEEMRKMQEEMRKMQEEMSKMDQKTAQQMLEQMKQMQQQGQSQQRMRQNMQQQMQQMQQQLQQMKEMKEMMDDLKKMIEQQENLTEETTREEKNRLSAKPDMSRIQEDLEKISENLGNRADMWKQYEEDAAKKDRYDQISKEARDLKRKLQEQREQNQPLTEKRAKDLMDQVQDLQRRMQNEASSQQGQEQPSPGQQQGQQQDQNGQQNLQQQMEEMLKESGQGSRSSQLENQQRSLEWQLQQMINKMKIKGMDASKLDEALNEMKEATKDLGNDQPGEAVPDQNAALKALQDGAQQMQQKMQQQMGGNGSGQGMPEVGDRGGQLQGVPDPLGRSNPNSNLGVDPSATGNQTREVRDQIRRRLENPDLPQTDRDYLERLLRGQNPGSPAPR